MNFYTYYYTVPVAPNSKQISVDDILSGEIENLGRYLPKNNRTTRTIELPEPYENIGDLWKNDEKAIEKGARAYWALKLFNEKYAALENRDMAAFYHSFRLPKASGGFRPINAPNEELRKAHDDLKTLFEDLGMLYHTAAYAYVPGRAPKMAVEKHKANNSNWCLRTDFSNFFGSSTPEFVLNMLLLQVPFCYLHTLADGVDQLKSALSLCFLHNGLPQGTTISPMLTNAMMIPIDFKLSKWLREHDFVYTRYADDIQISAYSKFNYHEIVKQIDNTLMSFGAPFRIKPEKTKFSSCAGVNYMLGLDYNADHDITVGHDRKRNFKAMINNFLADFNNGVYWSVEDAQHLRGLRSYYGNIEPEYFNFVIRRLEDKYSLSFAACMKSILKGAVKR